MKNSPQITAPLFLVTNNLTYQSNGPSNLLGPQVDDNTNAANRKVHSLQRINTADKQELAVTVTDEVIDILSNEAILNCEFRAQLEKIKNSMEIFRNSNLPIEIRLRMVESLRESIQTQFSCVQEANKKIRKKMDDLSKEAQEKASEAQRQREELLVKSNQVEHLKLENMMQEETVAKVRQEKNSLAVSLEDSKDEMADLEALIQEKKRVLENKMKYIEDLKVKMATHQAKKSPTLKVAFLSTASEEPSPVFDNTNANAKSSEAKQSIINTNTSIFQDVSSKLSGFMGMFSKKPSRSVLTPQVRHQISLASKPSVINEPKILTRKRNNSQSTADSTTR